MSQAALGIRLGHVTAVLACALQISISGAVGTEFTVPVIWKLNGFSSLSLSVKLRSEERRVGKECRSWTVKESEEQARIEADNPSSRVNPEGNVSPDVVKVPVPVLATVKTC